MLVLQAARGTHSLPLMDMLSVIAEEHISAQQLLAQHEAELFRKFLADSTRREVTTKVREYPYGYRMDVQPHIRSSHRQRHPGPAQLGTRREERARHAGDTS